MSIVPYNSPSVPSDIIVVFEKLSQAKKKELCDQILEAWPGSDITDATWGQIDAITCGNKTYVGVTDELKKCMACKVKAAAKPRATKKPKAKKSKTKRSKTKSSRIINYNTLPSGDKKRVLRRATYGRGKKITSAYGGFVTTRYTKGYYDGITCGNKTYTGVTEDFLKCVRAQIPKSRRKSKSPAAKAKGTRKRTTRKPRKTHKTTKRAKRVRSRAMCKRAKRQKTCSAAVNCVWMPVAKRCRARRTRK